MLGHQGGVAAGAKRVAGLLLRLGDLGGLEHARRFDSLPNLGVDLTMALCLIQT